MVNVSRFASRAVATVSRTVNKDEGISMPSDQDPRPRTSGEAVASR